MERIPSLGVGLFRFTCLISLVAGMQMAFEHEVAIGERPRVHRFRLHDPHWKTLGRACRAEFITPARQHNVIESTAGNQRGGGWDAEAHGQRYRLFVLVMLGDYLPHVSAGSRLEC